MLFQQRFRYIYNLYVYIYIYIHMMQSPEYSTLLQHALSGCWLPCIWNRSNYLNFATLCCTKRQSAQGFCILLEIMMLLVREFSCCHLMFLCPTMETVLVSLHEKIAWFVQNPAEHGMSQLINAGHMSYNNRSDQSRCWRINWEFHLVPFKELRARSQRSFCQRWRHFCPTKCFLFQVFCE